MGSCDAVRRRWETDHEEMAPFAGAPSVDPGPGKSTVARGIAEPLDALLLRAGRYESHSPASIRLCPPPPRSTEGCAGR